MLPILHDNHDHQKYTRIHINSINQTNKMRKFFVSYFPSPCMIHLTTRIQLFNVSYNDDDALKKFGEDKKLAEKYVLPHSLVHTYTATPP